MRKRMVATALLNALLALSLLPTPSHAGLPAAIEDGLKTSKYIYLSSTRKDGNLGEPAEIWFLYHQGSVYVGSSPKSWRARRIKWGRPQAKIWVGKRDGPSFAASGKIVDDAEVQAIMLKTFAEKYPEGWGRYERSFRDGFKDGSRVLIRYTPVDATPAAAPADKETGRRRDGETPP
jgi:hypothetical protein